MMNEISILISEIPCEYHSKDLRHFFSYSIEKDFFIRFHYRKRPHQSKKFNLALVKIKPNKYDEFFQMYEAKHWFDYQNQPNRTHLKCKIMKIKKFEDQDLVDLVEFRNIPNWMSQGNVGTPTKNFLNYINRCKMPSSMISKLGINIADYRRCTKKKYTNVQFDYDQDEEDKSEDELEEWERHESLHDDVTKQDRTSPYLYEDEIELKWEKGGSGLVFYTDENFWKDYENKDFDAETADDWDLDMSVYYELDQADKDSADLLDMRKQNMLRRGDTTLVNDEQRHKRLNPFANPKQKRCKLFDRDSFGRKQLEKLGWKEGESIGLRPGLKNALDASEAKKPMDKTGLGYHGEKVDHKEEKLRRQSDFYIGSIYDKNPNRPDTLLTRFEPTLKYK
ncbi:G patch domain-containing 3 [Brachionus plicatilis]|uniref:G patch domain-containing 3 n=1 Tax=Brachionus plicatilis TaxID=10195 RepID=A0A3M7SEF2_BRAPC|nr:G patch domain-containing 3 [Brachionus plicatilis]